MEGLLARSCVSTTAAAHSRGQCSAQNSASASQQGLGMQQARQQLNRCSSRLPSKKQLLRLRRHHPVSPSASLRDIEQMLRSGEIPTIAPGDAKPLLVVEGSPYKLLDVRPVWEREKAYVTGSVHVPLFVEDVQTDPTTLVKKWIQMGYGGMWLGQRLTGRNEDFVAQVEAAVPNKDERIMVACGEGLRSMLAIEELRKAGYAHVAWVAGGFNNVRDGDFATVENGTKLQWATVGGVSAYLLRFAVMLSGVIGSAADGPATKDN